MSLITERDSQDTDAREYQAEPTTNVTDKTIEALDGLYLMSSHFSSQNPDGPVVIISSGTAIPRQFYRHFAAYLAENYASLVITYDYRGIGQSWPDDGRTFKYLMSDWARQDFPAIIDWVKSNHPNKQITAIGHSFGGQTLGLTDRNCHISKIVTIASMYGYWREMSAPERYRVFIQLFVLSPIVARIYGYIPGKFGLGEDMAASALTQWTKWCARKDYFFNDPELPETRYFADYEGPVLAIGLDDDPWGRPHLIDALINNFTAAQITRKQYSSAQAGGKVGHFNFFKPQYRDTLWKPVVDWLCKDKQPN